MIRKTTVSCTHTACGMAALLFFVAVTGMAANIDSGTVPPQTLPLLCIKDFRFVGAFRLPSRKYGQSDLNYSEGPIAFNPYRQSLFIVGHAQQQAIAEFVIPELVNSTVVAELNMAADPIQPFATILDRASGGNPEGKLPDGQLQRYPDHLPHLGRAVGVRL